MVSRAARYAVALQALALLARLVWGGEISIHGGSAPIPVIAVVLLLQLPGLFVFEAFDWIEDLLHGVGDVSSFS